MLRKWWAFGVVSLLAAAGCENLNLGGLLGGGGNTNTEAVSQFIPDDITLDISELPDDDASAKSANAGATISGRNAYDRATRAASRVTHAFHRAARRAMALAAIIHRDMTSETQTQVEGTFAINGVEVSYRADFAAYDFDGDGNDDGSGNATTDPVALRVWVDRGDGFQRFLCALISQRPTTDNLGVGQVYVYPAAARGTEFNDLMIRTEWNRSDENHKWNQAWITGQIADAYRFDNGRLRVDHRTNGDTTGKTVRTTTMFAESPYGFDTFSMAGHWQRGSGAMLLKAQASGGLTQLNFDEICVSLTDRDATDTGLCDGFDTQDTTYLDAATGTDTDWPADFAQEPTFETTDTTST